METTSTEKKYNVTQKKLPGSLIEITGSLPHEAVEKNKDAALARIGNELSLPGFRKGKIPSAVVLQNVGELSALEEAANITLELVIPEILTQEKIPLIAMPSVRITKLAPGNPLEFNITVPVMPEIKLPDYKKISKKALAGKEESSDVTDTDIEQTLINIKKTIAEWKRRKTETPKEDKDEESDNHVCDDPSHEHHHKKETEKESAEKKEEKLPDLTDEDVRMIGDYKDVADFMEKLRLSIKEEKERKIKDKRRAKIAESIIEGTDGDIPEVMIEDEQNVMVERLKHDVSHMGMEFNQYLLQMKKTVEELKKDWHADAKKRVLLQLALGKIAGEEKIEAPKEEVEKEVTRYKEAMPDADENRIRERISELLQNEAVFNYLETQK